MKRKDLERANEILWEIKQLESFLQEEGNGWHGDIVISARRWFLKALRFGSCEPRVYEFSGEVKEELLQVLHKRLATLRTELEGVGVEVNNAD